MLTQKQWQWLADHHDKVRKWSWNAVILGLVVYVGLIGKTMLDKGKAPIPYKPTTDFRGKFDCLNKTAKYSMNSPGGNQPPKIGYYSDASILRLERHYTSMTGIDALREYPECVGAVLADNIDNPNPLVFILFDPVAQKPVYRIARIGNALKR